GLIALLLVILLRRRRLLRVDKALRLAVGRRLLFVAGARLLAVGLFLGRRGLRLLLVAVPAAGRDYLNRVGRDLRQHALQRLGDGGGRGRPLFDGDDP